MVVRLDAGREAVQAYVWQQAALGVDRVCELLEESTDRLMTLLADLNEAAADYRPAAAEWSVADVLHHVTSGFGRSQERIATLAGGRPWQPSRPGGGGLPDGPRDPFPVLRRAFDEGQTAVIALLRAATPGAHLDLRVDHAQGSFNWLEWAVFLHYVHVYDHVGQVEAIRRALREAER
jgi:hypothetical protein